MTAPFCRTRSSIASYEHAPIFDIGTSDSCYACDNQCGNPEMEHDEACILFVKRGCALATDKTDSTILLGGIEERMPLVYDADMSHEHNTKS